MFPAARIADPTVHGGLITVGFPTVLIGGMPAARIADMHTCPMVTGPVPHVGGPILMGALNVLVGNMPLARMMDQAICVGPPDIIASGLPTVLVGTSASGGSGGGGSLGAAIGAIGSAVMTILSPAYPQAKLLPDGTVVTVYATRDDAARAALNEANPQSIAANLEYGGMLYEHPDGGFGYTGPGRGTGAGFNPASTPIPAGTTTAGDYHTHADYSTIDPVTGQPVRTANPALDQYNSDQFSQTDRTGITSDATGNPGYTGYLGTPSGTFRKYDPATGTTSVL